MSINHKNRKAGRPRLGSNARRGFSRSSFPGHSFVFASEDGTFLQRIIVDPIHGSLHSYGPYYVVNDEKATLSNVEREFSQQEQALYWKWRKTLRFDTFYRNFTGRSYLATFPRKPPMHFMWPAQYFQQKHWVTTEETHLLTAPPEFLETTVPLEKRLEIEPIALKEYRTDEPFLNMTGPHRCVM